MRKIPATMATQHPDNASAPYWERDGDAFVSVYEELEECVSSFLDLGAQEFMWDWEGKYADEAVIDKLFSQYYKFFRRNRLGQDRFLTFRLPNVWKEKGYSLIRALMVILTSEDFARDLGLPKPLFEVILPMTEKAEQMLYIQDSFKKLARFKTAAFDHYKLANTDYVELIPLLEGVSTQMEVGRLLTRYVKLHRKSFGTKPVYLRPFLARSDPALISGVVANVLANKIALSEMSRFSRASGIKVFPIIGVGSLVFRGGLSPETVEGFLKEYGGVRTVTIQSAFRYDYPLPAVKKAISRLNVSLAGTRAQEMSGREKMIVSAIVAKFERVYQKTVASIIKDVEPVFAAVPRRRERRQHIGFLAYKRKMGRRELPRAINFTAGFYSIGVPPEFIGSGRVLSELAGEERELLRKYYIRFAEDFKQAGRFLNKENLHLLVKSNPAWAQVEQDVSLMEKFLKMELGPLSRADRLHANLAANVLLLKGNAELVGRLITETGKLRKSLG